MSKENQLFNRGCICIIYDEDKNPIASCDNEYLAQSIIKFDENAQSYEIIDHVGGKVTKKIDLLEQIGII